MPNPHSPEQPDPNDFSTAFHAGLQNSVLGLGIDHGLPSAQIPGKSVFDEQSDELRNTALRATQGLTTAVADLPINAAGFIAGNVGGAFALPQAMRSAMVTAYQQGGVHSFQDFWNMASNASVEGAKGYITGRAGEAVKLGTAASWAGSGAIAQTIAPLAAETAAFTEIGSRLNGKAPEPQDFLDNAILAGGLHAGSSMLSPVPAKLQKIYSDTGLHPTDVAKAGMNDPYIQQQLMSENTDTPNSFSGLKQPTVKSDFVIVDGKLVPGDKPEAQAEFPFKNTSVSELQEDAQSRYTPKKQLEAAKLHDPEAFEQLASDARMVKGGLDNIKSNNDKIDLLSPHEANVKELSDVREKLENPDVGVDEKRELGARELELQKTEGKDTSRAGIAQDLRDQNAQIMEQIKKTRNNEPLKNRLAQAWENGRDTIRQNLNDRIRNSVIDLHDEPTAKPFDYLNPDFSEPGEHTPQMTDSGKVELMDDSNLHLFHGDEGAPLSRDEIMTNIMKEHSPEVAEQMAPETVTKFTPEPEEGETKKEQKPEYVFGARKKAKLEIPSFTEMVEATYNKLVRLKNVSRDAGVSLAQNPYETMKHSDAQNRAMLSIGKAGEKEGAGYGVFSPETGEKLHDSLISSLEKNGVDKNNINDFKQFVIFKHGIDENAKNVSTSLEEAAKKKTIKTGVDDAEAKKFVAANESRFGEAQKAFTSWHNAMLQVAVDGDLITQSMKDNLEAKYPNYAPFNRLNEDETSKGSGTNKPNIFYERKGSDLKFLDPITSSMEKAFNIAKRVEENQAKLQTISTGGLNEAMDGELLKNISPENTVDLDGKEIENDPTFSRDADERRNLADDQVGFFEEGKYKVATFKDEALAQTLKQMKFDPGPQTWLKNLYGIAKDYTTIRRTAATANLPFLERHTIRANLFSFLLGANPISLLKAPMFLGDAISKNTSLYTDALKYKALDGSTMDIGDVLKGDLVAKDDAHGALSTIRNVAKSTFGVIHSMIAVTQNASALSIFSDKLSKLGETPTMDEKMTAGLETNNLFLNGLQVGSQMQGLNAMTAFQHYAIQGFGKGIESAIENPARFATAGAFLMAGSLLAYNSVKDDEQYNALPDYLKNSAVWFKVNGSLIPVPVPWEMGTVFCTVPRLLAQSAYEKSLPSASNLTEMAGSLIPLKLPTAVEDFRAIHDNYNSMTGKNTVPEDRVALAPRAQVQPYTSNTAYGISKFAYDLPGGPWNMGAHVASPMMVDHIIQNMIGQGGQDAIKVLETSLQSAGIKMPIEKSWEQLAVDQTFVRGLIGAQPTFNAQPIKDFKDAFEEVTNLKKSYDIINKANPDEGEKFANEHPEIQNYDGLKNAHDALVESNKVLQGVAIDPSLKPSDKKQVSDSTWRDTIAIVKQKLDEIKQASKINP